ncbi:MAG: GNAT family N-acetyltransferase [Pseudomonadales bacterium]
MNSKDASSQIQIGALQEAQLADAHHIMSMAFGTHLGVPEPAAFLGETDFVFGRYRADPSAAFAATDGDRLVGAAFANCWGSVGFFGPLMVHPEYWNSGVAKQLLKPVMECFERWGTQHAGLYTFANSTKHIGLYQKFGFWPQYLTVILAKKAQASASFNAELYSVLNSQSRLAALEECAVLTGSLFDGLDLRKEIIAVLEQNLGDTLIIRDGKELAGFAVLHCGAGTEAGAGRCYLKFAAVCTGSDAEQRLSSLLQACEHYALENSFEHVVAGVSVGRSLAYKHMLRLGFKAQQTGIAMHRPGNCGYNREDVFVLDDWR